MPLAPTTPTLTHPPPGARGSLVWGVRRLGPAPTPCPCGPPFSHLSSEGDANSAPSGQWYPHTPRTGGVAEGGEACLAQVRSGSAGLAGRAVGGPWGELGSGSAWFTTGQRPEGGLLLLPACLGLVLTCAADPIRKSSTADPQCRGVGSLEKLPTLLQPWDLRSGDPGSTMVQPNARGLAPGGPRHLPADRWAGLS